MWDSGQKTGHGIEVNDSGVYSGRFVNSLRDGHGRWDMCDGSTCVGTFGHSQQFSDVNANNTEFRNPYREGHPHGQVEITFGDGGYYRGTMVNGRITGYGEYQSGFNEVKVGNFKDGILHGPQSMHLNLAGETFTGTFDGGELHGEGRYSNKRGDTYKGNFDHSFRHGRGDAEYTGRGVYRGYFVNGLMTGKGELFFGKRPTMKKKKKENVAATSAATATSSSSVNSPVKSKSEIKEPNQDELQHTDNEVITAYKRIQSQYKRCCMGYMLADNILNGGAVMDTDKQIPSVIGRQDKEATLPISIMMRNIMQTTKRIKRKLEKMTDMDSFVRATMIKKKKSIFRQQRHYAKKTMYEDDMMVHLRKEDFDGRQRVREDRLTRTNMDKLMPTHHAVPRIKMAITDEPATHLLDIFKQIKLDPDAGYKGRQQPERVEVMNERKERGRSNNNNHNHNTKMDRTLPKIVLSDFEEVIERQRLIEYDAIWEKAEMAFVNNKRAANGDEVEEL